MAEESKKPQSTVSEVIDEASRSDEGREALAELREKLDAKEKEAKENY